MGESLNPLILNHALSLAMEWGADWLQPIQERLAKQHPELSKDALNRCDELCRTAIDDGIGRLRKPTNVEAAKSPWDPSVQDRWRAEMIDNWPWMSVENLDRLFSQCCYCSMK